MVAVVGDAPSPYVGLTVVEVADDPAGEFAGKLLAEMGAEVIKVEPPDGSPTRQVGPFVGDRPDPEESLTFWYYNRNKRSVVVDRSTAGGRAQLQRLLHEADIFVTTLDAPALDGLGLLDGRAERYPSLIVAAVTPFGLDGPWSQYLSSDLVALAAGGPLISCGYDDHTVPPIRPGGNQGCHTATSFAHLGILLALIERRRTGRGQLVDVSMHEALAVTVELANPYWMYQRALVQRQTCRHAQPEMTPPQLFAARDGHVFLSLSAADSKTWSILIGWMARAGAADDLTDERFGDPSIRAGEFEHLHSVVEAFFRALPAETLYREGQALGLPIGVLNAPEDLVADEHLNARGFFVDVDHDGPIGTVRYPNAPYRFSAFGPAVGIRPPRLGEHDDLVLGPGRHASSEEGDP